MLDYLQDIIQHTHNLGCIEFVKITGTDELTKLDAMAADRSLVIQAEFKNPNPEFLGVFGMPNMGNLKTVLSIDEYQEGAKIKVINDPAKGPVSLHFENANGDFTNDYRFIVREVIEDMLKTVEFKGVNWDVEFEPTVAGLQRLKFQQLANSEQTTFVARTEGSDLIFNIGDQNTHAGRFVFQHDVVGELKKGWDWPIGHVIAILSLPGDKVMRISDAGATQIIVDSGIAIYTYIIPAQTK